MQPITHPGTVQKIADGIFWRHWGLEKGYPVDMKELIRTRFNKIELVETNDEEIKSYQVEELKNDKNGKLFRIVYKPDLKFEITNQRIAMAFGRIVLGLDKPNYPCEWIFAAFLLIPSKIVLAAIHEGYEFEDLVKNFKVTEKLMVVKLVRLGIFPVSILDKYF